ncbi:MAG: hypothetical protein WCF65_04285 [Parachlamydiaceae bacterium]
MNTDISIPRDFSQTDSLPFQVDNCPPKDTGLSASTPTSAKTDKPKTPADKTVVTYITDNSEPLEKITKIVIRVLTIIKEVCGALAEAPSLLLGNLRNAVTAFDTFKIFGATKFLVSRQDNGQYLLLDAKKSWQKKADRVCLFVHSVFKTIKGLATVGLAKYGALAKNAIGTLPTFTLIMDSFVLFSTGFATWDNFLKLPTDCREASKAQVHLKKWEFRQNDINLLKDNDVLPDDHQEFVAYQEQRKTYYTRESADCLAKIEKLQKNNPKDDAALAKQEAEIAKLQAVKEKIEKRLEKINSRLILLDARAYVELGNDLAQAPIDKKISKWTVLNHDKAIARNNNILGIINNIGKIAVITFALALAALAVSSMPYIVSLLSLGIFVESIGLTKIFYTEFNPQIVQK